MCIFTYPAEADLSAAIVDIFTVKNGHIVQQTVGVETGRVHLYCVSDGSTSLLFLL